MQVMYAQNDLFNYYYYYYFVEFSSFASYVTIARKESALRSSCSMSANRFLSCVQCSTAAALRLRPSDSSDRRRVTFCNSFFSFYSVFLRDDEDVGRER